ncbi:MAG TPA: protein phosphatase 2C domain-containing protein, partial [Pseudonocardiaceae bacterium]|nr:protein phosphatase 2C domain-containing protein [Pseudonocardiaceae bacterium]
FRSDRGSLFAVRAMVAVFDSFQDQVSKGELSLADRSALWEQTAKPLVASWRAKMYADLISDPPRIPDHNKGEPGLLRLVEHLRARSGYVQVYRLLDQIRAFEEFVHAHDLDPHSLPADPNWDAERLGNWHTKAYGTTLLAVLVNDDALHWLQIGDGAMVQIIGGQAGYLTPPPPDAIANATPSLCDDNAGEQIRCGTEPMTSGRIPSALVLVTDGLPNSYERESGFFQFCQEVADRARTNDIIDDLGRWLPEISRQGSGDDMTVALAWATEVPSRSPNDGEDPLSPTADELPDHTVAEGGSHDTDEQGRKERDHHAQGG